MSNNRMETNRLHEELRSAGIEDFPVFEEVELTEAALSANDLTLDDVQLNVDDENVVVWIGDTFAIQTTTYALVGGIIDEVTPYRRHFFVTTRFDARDFDFVHDIFIYSRTLEATGPAAEFLVPLLARDTRFGFVGLYGRIDAVTAPPLPLSYDALEHVLQLEIPRKIHFGTIAFNERQCFLLARAPNEHVNLSFRGCSFEDEGSALADTINDNQGVQKITFDCLNSMSPENVRGFFNGLRRNTHVKELCFGQFFLAHIDDAQARAIFGPLANNQGLESLSLSLRGGTGKFPLLCSILQENNWLKKLTLLHTESLGAEYWSLLSHSVKIHPSIEIMDIQNINDGEWWSTLGGALSCMLETNTVIRRIVLEDIFYRTAIFQSDIWPRLIMNRFRPLFAAIKEEQDPSRRAKLFGWALHLVKSNPRFPNQFALLHRLASENPDIVMRYYVRQGSQT